ncbi:hypothetical protein PanWU01x14_142390 [Parasponia andersonii]|uniref:Uncharacterized protein n=1 Tax=Parasponia andersonii TaxID=3476 RepID=A0A2P5CLA2_PARAD|nr:hypothetical protein PanWU01x14_142390 [Parasponia andersonii]
MGAIGLNHRIKIPRFLIFFGLGRERSFTDEPPPLPRPPDAPALTHCRSPMKILSIMRSFDYQSFVGSPFAIPKVALDSSRHYRHFSTSLDH